MPSKPAKFVWYDLMTPEMKTSADFYARVVGWTIADSGMPGMNYSILKAGGIDVGGMMPPPPGTDGMPPMWNGHIFASDVDASAKKAVRLGGKIKQEATDIPGVGRFAVIADPSGATFILFKPNSSEPRAVVPDGTPGHIGWRELHAGDGKAAWEFYSGMFGWTKDRAMDMGPMGVYQLFAAGGPAIGAMMTKTPDTPVPHWRYYFNVDAIDAAAARVTKAGGKIVQQPMEVPNNQWIIVCTDPQGAEFALLAPKR